MRQRIVIVVLVAGVMVVLAAGIIVMDLAVSQDQEERR
jgi:hypothetical protein